MNQSNCNIIHSYWSKPYFTTKADKGGWNKNIFHFMSCAFSCLKFNEFHKISLITDKAGKELFIDKLGLPYHDVCTPLDVLNDVYPEYLWAIGKLYTYSIMEEPFIHVDNDIFIWESLGQRLLSAPLVAHNLEVSYPHNKVFFTDILNKFRYVPDILVDSFRSNDNVNEINAGILGGTDLQFFKEYCTLGFDFVDKNIDIIRKLDRPGMFNVIYEQFLFHALAKKNEKNHDTSTSHYIIVSPEYINNISENLTYELIANDRNSPTGKPSKFTICDNREHWIFQAGKWSIPICGDLSNIISPQSEEEQKPCLNTLYRPLFNIIFL